MGFTIEDMLTISKDRYEMELIAGKNGWANSISWIMMIEDVTILRSLKGKELAITTGLGFPTEEKLLDFAKRLVDCHAAGLMINTGKYVMEIPDSLIRFCDENDLPLLSVPWRILLADMIKDLSMHLFFQGVADEQINNAVIHAIEAPSDVDLYRTELLPYFDVDGMFQVVLFSIPHLGEMDTVERRKLGYRLQIYLKNITHNGIFLYYDEAFALITNNVDPATQQTLIEDMLKRAKRQMPDTPIYIGNGSPVTDLSQLSLSYHRAKNALQCAISHHEPKVNFDDMGIYRLLYSVNDPALLHELVDESLLPLIEYDRKHNSDYLETLRLYLKHDGSIQAVAEELFTHRNTVNYRMNNIKKLLHSDLDTSREKLKYQIALFVYQM